MDYGKITLDEMKKGYKYEKEQDVYVCNHCGQIFHAGQVFQMDDSFFIAESAVRKHIRQIHGSNLEQLLCSESKYNTLTQNQRDLLAMFYSKMPDKDMAKKLNVTEATIRRQRFTFREKAKQAKFYLAMYEMAFEDEPAASEQMIPIHNHAAYVDDRYLITEDEKQQIVETFFSSTQPLVLKSFSPKEKKKVVILGKIAEQFVYGKKYSEREVNEILRPVYEDYMTIRRYLVMVKSLRKKKLSEKSLAAFPAKNDSGLQNSLRKPLNLSASCSQKHTIPLSESPAALFHLPRNCEQLTVQPSPA